MIFLEGRGASSRVLGLRCTHRKFAGISSLVRANDSPQIPVMESVMVHKRPIFPGFYKTVTTSDAAIIKAFNTIIKSNTPYIGFFLSKHPDKIENGSSNCESFRPHFRDTPGGRHCASDQFVTNSLNAFNTTANHILTKGLGQLAYLRIAKRQ